MKFTAKLIGFSLCLAISSFVNNKANAQAKSEWVYLNDKGKLTYKTLPQGDRIMDFSFAGYMGGGIALPNIDVKITLNVVAGDNADVIQAAIDQVSKNAFN
jgi:hypothetical protein